MRYSTKSKNRIYIKGYRFLHFAKNMGKSLNNKYDQKLLDSTKNPTTDAIKTASNRTIQKTADATGDWIGNKIADIIASISKSSTKLHSKKIENGNANNEIKVPKNIHIFRRKTANCWWIKIRITI